VTVDVAALRSALSDPVAVCAALGLKGKRQPRGMVICCPVHDDREASCSVRLADSGTIGVRCFGCGFAGDVLHLIAAVRGLTVDRDFPEVAREAADLANIHVAAHEPRKRESRRERLPMCSTIAFDAIAAVLARSGRLDEQEIAGDVVRYLEVRAILAAARAGGWFALPAQSWAQREWRACLYGCADARDDVTGEHRPAWTRPDLDASGLFWRDGFAHPQNRLCIPWRDHEGRVQTLQRRRLDADERKKYVFPREREARLPYGIERIRANVPIVFVEGAIDTLARRALDRRDGRNRVVLGLPGVGGWRSEWAQLGAGREVVLALDGDDAGDRATDKIAADLFDAGATRVLRTRPMAGRDWTAILAETT